MISCVLITLNEEKNIPDCLTTLSWADEIMVLDGGSTDRTITLAKEFGARVEARPFDNFARQKNAALDLASGGWRFLIDADERVPQELAQEIREAVGQSDVVGYWVPRKNFIFGRWIRHTGWHPDYQMRLTRQGRAHYDEHRQVHEVVLLDGPADYLKTPLIHYNYDSIGQFVEKQGRYTEMAAHDLWREGVRAKSWSPFLQPWRDFWRRFVTWGGYRDGGHGLLLSLLMAYYEGVKYWRLRQFSRREE